MGLKSYKKLLSAACNYSYTRLALNYYMYYDILMEELEDQELLKPQRLKFHQLLKAFLDGTCSEAEIADLRNQVISVMETTTGYTDSFQAYEYILNRLEGRFSPHLLKKTGNPDQNERDVKRIMSYISSGSDVGEINDRTSQVLGQLPVRMTRQKFFELVEQGMSLYVGNSVRGLTDRIDMLRSEALLKEPKEGRNGYEGIDSLLRELKQADYRNMTADQFRHLSELLGMSGSILMDCTEENTMLIDLINDLYILLLTRPYAMTELTLEQNVKKLLRQIENQFELADGIPIDQVVEEEQLEFLEGKQEASYEQWLSEDLEAVLQQTDGKDMREALRKTALLISDSSFMSLEEETAKEEIVDEKRLKAELEPFFAELTEGFKGMPQVLKRAVMAKVLGAIPPFWKYLDQIETYVRGSLESCSDIYEREVTIKLLEPLMEQEGWDI